MYSTYEDECEAAPTDRKKIMVLGGGPNRIGQGIEFDYCCVHAALALREDGYETIMVNCNPETVSTDYDTSDRLYFEPLTLEDVLEIVDKEKPVGVIVQYGGQTPLKLALDLEAAGVPIIGTIARHRSTPPRTASASSSCCTSSACASRRTAPRAPRRRRSTLAAGARLSAGGAPELRARRPRDGDRARADATSSATCARRSRCRNDSPVLLDRFLERRDRGRRRLHLPTATDGVHRRHHGAHRAGRRALRRLGLLAAAVLAAAAAAGRACAARPR